MATVINRKAYRQVVADELTPLLVGTGLPCQAVYGYTAPTFDAQSPVVTVESMSSGRDTDRSGRFDASEMLFAVMVFVAWSDAKNAYYTDDSEDALDDIEQIIGQWVNDNGSRATGAAMWTNLKYAERTTVGMSENIGGLVYRQEQIVLRFTVSPNG